MRLKSLLSLAPALFCFFVSVAHAEVLGTVDLSVQVTNEGMPEFGFTTPGSAVAQYIQLNLTGVRVESTDTAGVVRMVFSEPVVLNLSDLQTGEVLAQRPLRFINIQIGESELALRRLLSLSRTTGVMSPEQGFEAQVDQFNQSLRTQGVEQFLGSRESIPEVYWFSRLGLGIRLSELMQIAAPVVPYSIRTELRRVNTPTGKLDSAMTSLSGIQVGMTAQLGDPLIQEFLGTSEKVKSFRDQRAQSILNEILGRNGPARPPLAQVIPFPRPRCTKLLTEE